MLSPASSMFSQDCARSDPSLKSNAAHNFLLSSVGVGEHADLEVLRNASRPIDVEKIMKEATAVATVDILRRSGANGGYCWELLRAMTEEECKPLELPATTKNKK